MKKLLRKLKEHEVEYDHLNYNLETTEDTDVISIPIGVDSNGLYLSLEIMYRNKEISSVHLLTD